MLQSSSATTSIVVALVASGSVTLQGAVPIIMGANVGTTITSTIVSLGFINKKKEFRRAVAAGTYDDFFNILTVVVVFPLEYYYGFLSTLSEWITNLFYTPVSPQIQEPATHFWLGFTPISNFLLKHLPSPFFLTVLALILLFTSILIFRKLISGLLIGRSPEGFSRFFFKSQLKSFAWGLLTTAAIRSSTITTSVVVPIVAKKIVTIKQAAPFIMGANIGTTITAFIAAMLNANTAGALSIALAHFLFNFIGVLIFFPVPVLRRLPIELANSTGELTRKYRMTGFVYLLTTFFFVPFSLIYFNQDAVRTLSLTYRQTSNGEVSNGYRIVATTNTRIKTGEWIRYEGIKGESNEEPSLIYPVSVKNNTLFIGDQMFLFNKPGFCWDGEDEKGKFQSCVENILHTFKIANTTFDSVFVFQKTYNNPTDTIIHKSYISAPYKIQLQQETVTAGKETKILEQLVRFETND
jgi:solute carrier family 34 (sodium-dependent phosphate cotransporter)